MKKTVKLVLITLFCFILTACGSAPKDSAEKAPESGSASEDYSKQTKDYAEKALKNGNFSEFMKKYDKADSGRKSKMADAFTKACIDISIKALESNAKNLSKGFEGLSENKNDSNFNKLYRLKQLVADYTKNKDKSLKYFDQCDKVGIDPSKDANIIKRDFYIAKIEHVGNDYYHMSTGYKSIPNYEVFGQYTIETSRTNFSDYEVESYVESKHPIVDREGLYTFYVVKSRTTKIETGQGFERAVTVYTYVPDYILTVISKYKEAKNNMDNILKQVKNLPNASVSTLAAGEIRKGVIIGNDVIVRKDPSTEHKNIGVFYKGDVVRVVGEEQSGSHTWYKIEYDNPNAGLISGYVRSDFVNINPDASESDTTSSGKGIITGTEVRIRSGASTESEIMGYFNKGETVDILDTASGWIKVKRSNGTVGWVYSQFCSIK